MQSPGNHDGVSLGRQTTAHRTDIMQGVVSHHIVGSDESRHIATCLPGQIGVNMPIVLGTARTLNSLADITRTTVVGSNHQVPVAKDLIEVAQQVGGGIGGLDGIPALVHQRVDLQIVLLTSGKHKLPKTSSSYT